MYERTVALIKPDAWGRLLVGEVLQVIEQRGNFDLLHIERVHMNNVAAAVFYGRQHAGQPYFNDLVNQMSKAPCLALLLGGEDAIARWRTLMGPLKWPRPSWTIRGTFCSPDQPLYENIVHGSDSPEAYEHEVAALGWRHRALG